jgi:hypothetical protein
MDDGNKRNPTAGSRCFSAGYASSGMVGAMLAASQQHVRLDCSRQAQHWQIGNRKRIAWFSCRWCIALG